MLNPYRPINLLFSILILISPAAFASTPVLHIWTTEASDQLVRIAVRHSSELGLNLDALHPDKPGFFTSCSFGIMAPEIGKEDTVQFSESRIRCDWRESDSTYGSFSISLGQIPMERFGSKWGPQSYRFTGRLANILFGILREETRSGLKKNPVLDRSVTLAGRIGEEEYGILAWANVPENHQFPPLLFSCNLSSDSEAPRDVLETIEPFLAHLKNYEDETQYLQEKLEAEVSAGVRQLKPVWCAIHPGPSDDEITEHSLKNLIILPPLKDQSQTP